MTVAKMRPTFELRLPLAFDETVKQVGEILEHPEWKGTSLFFGNYAELHIPKSELRYWSPHLSLYFDGNQKKHTFLGDSHHARRFGPSFAWFISPLAFTAFFSLMYTYSLWLLGDLPGSASYLRSPSAALDCCISPAESAKIGVPIKSLL